MAYSDIAYVRIERIIAHDAAATERTGKLGGEPGDTSEWLLRLEVNGQIAWWQRSGIADGKEYRVGREFAWVPLVNGNLTIKITGYEQDTFGDTPLHGRTITLRPAELFPYGANDVWVDGGSHGGLDGTWVPGKEGAFGFAFSIRPLAQHAIPENREYLALIRRKTHYYGYWVDGWEGFTRNHDTWKAANLRLRRVSASQSDPARPTFSKNVGRTFLGVYAEGSGNAPFWLLGLEEFRRQADKHEREGLRIVDIFAYFENGTPMIGGTFEPGEPTRLAVAPRDEFEREWVERAKGGERLIAIDTYHDGRQRWLVGLYEKGSGNALRVGERLGSFEARKAEYDARGYHLVDICVYNEGGEMRVCGVWTEKGPASRIFRAQSWNELVDRIDIATANDWHIAAIDTWSPAEDA